MNRRLGRFAAVALLILLTPGLHAQESPEQAANPYMKQLLEEIRMLRLSFQHATLSAYRGQLMIERLRLQQETVSNLESSLERTRGERRDIRSQIDQIEDYAEEMEGQMSGEFDPERVRAVENEKRMISQRIAAFESRLEQLTFEGPQKPSISSASVRSSRRSGTDWTRSTARSSVRSRKARTRELEYVALQK